MSEELTREGNPAKGFAIAALVCGIIGLCVPLAAIAALVLGIIALVKTKPGQSKGMAIAGTVMGGIGVLLLPMLLIPVMLTTRRQANMMIDGVNLRTIVLAECEYANGHPNQTFSLNDLVKSGSVTPEQLVSKLDERLEASQTPTAENANKISSYILVPDFKNNQHADAIAVFVDPNIPAYHDKVRSGNAGIVYVAYADGHIDSEIPRSEIENMLKKQVGLGIDEVIAKQRGK